MSRYNFPALIIVTQRVNILQRNIFVHFHFPACDFIYTYQETYKYVSVHLELQIHGKSIEYKQIDYIIDNKILLLSKYCFSLYEQVQRTIYKYTRI